MAETRHATGRVICSSDALLDSGLGVHFAAEHSGTTVPAFVVRYEGPRGGPGMQEMLSPTSAIMGMGLGDKCALVTDTNVGFNATADGGDVARSGQHLL